MTCRGHTLASWAVEKWVDYKKKKNRLITLKKLYLSDNKIIIFHKDIYGYGIIYSQVYNKPGY